MSEANNYVRFTGEFSHLKKMGYEFQKLYASNYQQWHNQGIRVWRRGTDITMDLLPNEVFTQLVELVLQRKSDLPFRESKMFKGHVSMNLFVNNRSGLATLDGQDYEQWITAMGQAYKNKDPEFDYGLWSITAIRPEHMEPIFDLCQKGWLEIKQQSTTPAKNGKTVT